MLDAVAIIPSAPVLVPELAGAAAAEQAELRDAVLAAAAGLPARWVAVGVGSDDAVLGAPLIGTFAGYGADVRVTLGPGRDAAPPAQLPLCALIAGWVRGRAHPGAAVQVRVCSDRLDDRLAVQRGRALRAELDATHDPVGVLVVADGANTLTAAAPGGYDPDAGPVQDALDAALAAGDTAALAGLPASILGRVGYQVLAGLAERGPWAARGLYRGAPYGVGYFVGVWTPAP